jgi:hypothetical protein
MRKALLPLVRIDCETFIESRGSDWVCWGGKNRKRKRKLWKCGRSVHGYLTTQEADRAEADRDAILSAMRYANDNLTKAVKILNVSGFTA